mgnify:FL=1
MPTTKESKRARIEKERLQSNGGIEPEESKLKHNDDYRGKNICLLIRIMYHAPSELLVKY